MKKLIEKAIPIVKKYEIENIKNGYSNNIYSLLNVERDEVTTHEATIYAILQNQYSNDINQEICSAFINAMNLEEKYTFVKWKVEKEFIFDEGRIDLFFHSSDNSMAVIVELKIDAEDQENQLARYYEFVKKHYINYQIIYLTLDGKEPSKQSVDGIPETFNICSRSFSEHIDKWLNSCTDILEENLLDSSLIKQYQILVRKIAQEMKREKEISELFCDRDSLLAGKELIEAFEEAKEEVRNQFFDKLYEKISIHEKIYDYYKDEYREYGIGIKIKEFHARNKGYSIIIYILYFESDRKLEYCIYYVDKNDEIIESNLFKEKNKRKNEIVEQSIQKAFKRSIRDNQYKAIYYQNVKNSKNEEYDMKNFNESCVDLKDEDIMERETAYIAGQFISYARELRKLLKEELESV